VAEAALPTYNSQTGQYEYVNAFAIIEVKAGVYREAVLVGSPVALLGELGMPRGPVEIRGDPVSEDYSLQLSALCVVDGFVVTHDPGVKGSGVYVSSWGGLKRLVNCVIRNNHGGSYGGGIYSYYADLVLDHCTVYRNTAGYYGNGIYQSGGRMTLRNSIVWNPVTVSDPNLADQEVSREGWIASVFEVIHSIVGGGEEGGLNLDPQLTPAGWLKSTSPAINRAGVVAVVGADIHGEVRQQPDLGADEYRDDNGAGDGDGLPDWAEGADDNDGVSALEEYLIDGTNPRLADTDGDGLNDGAEKQAGTNPLAPDTDGDGIPDGWEVANGFDPKAAADAAADPDNDGLTTLREYQLGTNAKQSDTDGDGMPDGWEHDNGLNPLTNDAAGDLDQDGISNLGEYQSGTLANQWDTDGDLLSDGWELANGLNPVVNDGLEDKDGDRVPNLFEFKRGTRPNDPASKPAATFIVNPATGGNSPTDNVYATIQEAVNEAAKQTYDGQTGKYEYVNAFAIIEVKSGVYREAVVVGSPVALLGELGTPSGPVEIRGNPVSEDYSLRLNAIAVIDGVVVTHEPGVKGSGVYVSSSDGRKRLINCVIRNNQSSSQGGGIYSDNADLVLDHCTVCWNTAGSLGNGIYQSGGRVALRNSIVWNPVIASDPNLADQDVFRGGYSGGVLEVIHSIVGGGEQGALSLDPQLTPAGWLTSRSPAINRAGANALAGTDIQGEPRQRPDLGADEFVDSDRDSLPDLWELRVFGNLFKGPDGDEDNDQLTNRYEFVMGFAPSNADSLGNGRGDYAEALSLFNTASYLTGWLSDLDRDGLPNTEEVRIGSNPFVADTNQDGIPDGLSVAVGINPVSLDIDGDGISNSDEIRLGTSPWEADTDGDGRNDSVDVFPLDPARWELPPGSPGDTTPPSIQLLSPREARQI
jgi:predicted outer membrane repeat protein